MTSTQDSSPVIRLPVIKYELVHARDPVEVQKLVEACRPPPDGLGFFFVDLSGPSTNESMLDVAGVKSSSQVYFTQQHEVKMDDFVQGIDRGFKPSDKIETFEVSTDIAAKGSLELPVALQSSSDQIPRLLSSWDTITKELVSALLPTVDPTGIVDLNKIVGGPSDSGLKLCLMNSSIPVGEESGGKHTDSGLLTLMYYDAASLELAVTDTSGNVTWSHPLKPVNGCAIANVGDSLQTLAEGRVYSHVHRSVQPDGEGRGVCYPLYFLRPQHK